MNKIWIINQFAHTPDLAGHTRQYEIAEYLAKHNWEVDVFASDFIASERRFKKLKNFQIFSKRKIFENFTWNWLKVSPYTKNNWKRKLNMFSFCIHVFFHLLFLGFINILRGNKNIIILGSSPQLPAAYISFLIAKFFKKDFVLEVRDLWPQILIEQGGYSKNNITYKILSWMEKELYLGASSIVILSKGLKDIIYKKGGKKVEWIPNGADLNKFKFAPLPEEILIEKFNNERTFNILYPGAHGESNDLYNIINTAKLLDKYPIKFFFVGDGPEKKSLIKKASGLKNVIFRDPVPKSEIPKLLKEFDSIIVSLKNTKLFSYGVSPNKLYDAYAIGRPVITTITGLINNEVEEYSIGVTAPPNQPEELAESIKYLISCSRKKREQMSINARKLAERIYSRQAGNKKYNKILINLINKKYDY